MKANEAKRLKELEQENSWIKHLLADADLNKGKLKEGILRELRRDSPPKQNAARTSSWQIIRLQQIDHSEASIEIFGLLHCP